MVVLAGQVVVVMQVHLVQVHRLVLFLFLVVDMVRVLVQVLQVVQVVVVHTVHMLAVQEMLVHIVQ
jgi:hypothetical protein